MNQSENNDDNVRPPDPTITEQLIEPDEFSYNYYDNNYNDNFINEYDNIDEILKQSLIDFEEEEEQKMNKLLMAKKQELIEKYVIIKKKLQKIQGHDLTNKDTYETVISIIEMYEMEYLNKYMLDETSYNNIFKIIKTIRLTKEEFSLLETLIIMNK
jgi:hypothetical protein